MRYVLNDDYRFRGWHRLPTGILNNKTKRTQFYTREQYLLLLKCDGAHDIDVSALSEEDRNLLEALKKEGVIREAMLWDFISPKQEYVSYPARYKRQAHWSITGACNLKCRHCFMSAPHAKHGSPSHEQIINIADQLAECGIFSVGLTGGEPLIRSDFLQIIDALNEREIGIDVIFTNGWLVDERFLDALDERHVHPSFQLSFDGVGMHDFLRGIDGAEERTLNALRLLKERDYDVSVSMCVHRRNRDTLRETVKLMAEYGVDSMKIGSMMELGDWMAHEMQTLQLSRQEELEMFESYIPQYFEDDAPVSIMMSDTLMYTPGDKEWKFYAVTRCPKENEFMPSCGVIVQNLYIGAEGMVTPCMGMGDCGFAKNFPNLFQTPLKDILHDSPFNDLCNVSVKEIRDHNPKCRECRFVDRCIGGCRNSALIASDDYYGIDEGLCYFFENGWEERLTKAAQGPFEEYLKRNPPREDDEQTRNNPDPNCP